MFFGVLTSKMAQIDVNFEKDISVKIQLRVSLELNFDTFWLDKQKNTTLTGVQIYD